MIDTLLGRHQYLQSIDTEFDSINLSSGSAAKFLIANGLSTKAPYRVIYDVYIRSAEWRDRKRRYFDKHPKQCASCGSREHIHLHHKTYARITQEKTSDLVAVCDTCHNWIHHLHRSSKANLEQATNAVLRSKWNAANPDPERWNKQRKPGKRGSKMDGAFTAVRKSQRKRSQPLVKESKEAKARRLKNQREATKRGYIVGP